MNNLIIDSKKETDMIVEFIRKIMRKTGFKKMVVGTSGGVDSAVVLALCVKALGKENVMAVRMPCGDNKDRDGVMVVEKLEMPEENVLEINIESVVKAFGLTNENKGNTEVLKKLRALRLGNVIARVRMIVLYDLAKQNGALVCGTENKSEELLGYYTRFGDEASDVEPIKHLYKTQVYQLANYLGIPEAIITKKPTAGLWEGQTDAAELGFTYEEADEILYQRFDLGLLWEKIESRIKNPQSVLPSRRGLRPRTRGAQLRGRHESWKELKTKDQQLKTLLKIKQRVEGNWFKRDVPYKIEA